MPKAERGTPKDIANRAKAKGLQKLRWYCQMCQKQCRDENGMKCHMTSESHLRNMKLFSQNAGSMMNNFSIEFEKIYVDTLKRRHGTQRVNANNVYQEVIQDKHHVHMNATMWATLTHFVQYLGKKGLCVVDETERGWYVQYIERDPFLLKRREVAEQRAEAERLQEMRTLKRMEQQRIQAAKALDEAGNGNFMAAEASNLDRSTITGKISLSIGKTSIPQRSDIADSKKNPALSLNSNSIVNGEQNSATSMITLNKLDSAVLRDTKDNKTIIKKSKRPMSELERIMRETESKKRKDEANEKKLKSYERPFVLNKKSKDALKDRRKENWIKEGIVVRIVSKKLKKRSYYKQKGIIESISKENKLIANVLLEGENSGEVVAVDQKYLETVIPKLGKEVLIVNGRGRGQEAIVRELDKSKYKATLALVDKRTEPLDDALLFDVDYEDVSELA